MRAPTESGIPVVLGKTASTNDFSAAPSEHGSLELFTIIKFPVLNRHNVIVNQIIVARFKLPHFNAAPLEHAMAKTLDDLVSARASKPRKLLPQAEFNRELITLSVAEKEAARDNNWRNK